MRIATKAGKVTFIVALLKMRSLLHYGVTSSNEAKEQHAITKG